MAEAEARGYRKGMSAAEAQARTEAERRSAAALDRISQTLNGLVQKFAALERKLEVEAVEVAVAVANELAPALMAREPIAEISQLATSCFSDCGMSRISPCAFMYRIMQWPRNSWLKSPQRMDLRAA